MNNNQFSQGIVFYTDNEPIRSIRESVMANLKEIAVARNLPIVCSSLKWKMDFGDKNIFFPSLKRSPLSQFKQILGALEHSDSDIIFFCEADILYHYSHFDYIPPTNDAYYYNTNVWKIWIREGIATRTDINMQLSGFCGHYDLLLGHYQRRVAKVLQNQKDILASGKEVRNEGYSKHMGYEPGAHMKPRGVDEYPMIPWQSEWPILDLRHDNNLTKGKRHFKDFHDKRWTKGWKESTYVPGWGKVSDIIKKYGLL